MAVVAINPIKVVGPWLEGYVLERQHTVSSEFLGHDSSGRPQFDSKYSALGELVYRLKNREDKSTLDPIADTALQFVRERWRLEFDLIVPVPPSRKRQTYQPVIEIANAIGIRLQKPVAPNAVIKIRETPELKDIYDDFAERRKLLAGAFEANVDTVGGKAILLLDDLYRSGATAVVVAQSIIDGGAARVYMLAMTKTRTRR